MKVHFVSNGSDITRGVESAVSVGCSKEHVDMARGVLGKLNKNGTVFSWRRIRDEGPKPKYEQMFALAPDSAAAILDVYQCLREAMGAYICQRGGKPTLQVSPENPSAIDVVNFESNYNELLAWRYRLSCCLGKDPDSQTLKVIDRSGECGGSLTAACMKYHPPSETVILSGARTGILKSKGPEHFQGFVRSCVNDTTVLTPGITDVDASCRIIRRAIRFAVDELLGDTFVREYAEKRM